MTREEHIEDIAFDIDCYNFFKQMSKKYNDTKIGFTCDLTLLLLKEKIRSATKYHKNTYNERLSVSIIEGLL